MKRIILSMALVISVAGVFGQKANVSKAKSKASSGDYADARELIKEALANPETANAAETWYVAGLIGEKENDALWIQAQTNKEYDKHTKGKAMIESVNYYLKADELGQIPNEKGKVRNRYRKDIINAIKSYYTNPSHLYSYFAELYLDDNDSKGALDVSKVYLSIPDMPVMQGQNLTKDSLYYTVQYYAGKAASAINMHNDAIAMFKKSIADNFNIAGCYQSLSEEYKMIKDTVNHVKTLKDAIAVFPKEPWFLGSLINHYVNSGQNAEAVKYLDDAIRNEPDVAEYYFVKGQLESKLDNAVAAEENYNKALEINPDFAGAYAGKGYLIFNQAVKVIEDANEIRDNTKYQAEIDRATSMMRQSLPLMEKAAQLNDKEIEYLENLKLAYYRLNMTDKYDEVTAKIKALQE